VNPARIAVTTIFDNIILHLKRHDLAKAQILAELLLRIQPNDRGSP
jgi:hypothetical protein